MVQTNTQNNEVQTLGVIAADPVLPVFIVVTAWYLAFMFLSDHTSLFYVADEHEHRGAEPGGKRDRRGRRRLPHQGAPGELLHHGTGENM